ncbi:MAG: S-layer homology domain-containing protein [Armatimonas sp.]
MRRFVMLGAALAVAGAASAQTAFKDVPAGHFAQEAVTKMATMGVMAPEKKGSSFDGNKPVTRYELALTLWRFAQYLERTDKQKKSKFQAQAPKDGATAVKQLVAMGYLPKNTPLATSGTKVVTATQLADALTAVIVKVRANRIPMSPDSEHAPISRPDHSHGT